MDTPTSTRDSPQPAAAHWGALERALLRRRWGAVEPALRLELVAALGLALAAAATWIVASRHARRLRRPEGPAWLALPLEPAAIERHLAWSSRARASGRWRRASPWTTGWTSR